MVFLIRFYPSQSIRELTLIFYQVKFGQFIPLFFCIDGWTEKNQWIKQTFNEDGYALDPKF